MNRHQWFKRLYRTLLSRAGAIPLLSVMLVSSSAHGALLVRYSLDQASGSVVSDLAPNPVDATVMEGAASWNLYSGPLDVSYVYHNNGQNGSGVRVSGGPEKLDDLGSASFTGWINVTSAVTTDGAADRVFSKRLNTIGYFDLVFSVNGGLTFESRLNGSTSNTLVSTTAIDFNSGWIFYAVTRDATTGKVEIYIGDTASEAITLVGSGYSQVGVIESAGADLMIGNVHAQPQQARSPVADFSDFRIYDEVFSVGELNQIRLENLHAVPEPAVGGVVLAVLLGLGWMRTREDRKKAI